MNNIYIDVTVYKDKVGEQNDGEKYDHDSDNAPEYGCGNMTFESKEPTQLV